MVMRKEILVVNAWNLHIKAKNIAMTFHKDQVDKAGMPYFDHLQRVVESIISKYNFEYLDYKKKVEAINCTTVAYLHDVLEDTDCTEEYLREQGFSDDIIEGIKSVTRNEGESYGDFVKRAAANQYGKIVKMYDLIDNLDIKRLKRLTCEDLDRVNKYLKWYHYLEQL